jgi:hypothetical protein
MEEMTNESQPVQPEAPAMAAVEGENTAAQPVESTEVQEQAPVQPGESDTHDTQNEGNDGVDPSSEKPADLSEREQAAVRKMHEATQQASQYKKEADAFQELLNHPEFNEFLQWQKQRNANPAGAQPPEQLPQVQLSEEEFLAAQADPAKFEGLLQNRIQQTLGPIANQAIQKINGLERELAISKQEREIDAFAAQHKDFWDKNPELMKAAISKTKDLSQAYNLVNQWEKAEQQKALSAHQKKVQEKRQASSASPSKSMDPKTIYVSSETEANKIAFQYAKQGKRVDVQIDPNKAKKR